MPKMPPKSRCGGTSSPSERQKAVPRARLARDPPATITSGPR